MKMFIRGQLPYSDDTFLKSYRERILQLAKLVPKLVIVAPFPESPQWGPNTGRVYLQDKQDSIPKIEQYLDLQKKVLNILDEVSKLSNVNVIYPHRYLSNGKGELLSLAHLDTEKETIPLYYDDDHLNEFGSKLIVEEIFNCIE